jgi:CDP-4-dehydro-6-deoxyglucose reductase, E3
VRTRETGAPASFTAQRLEDVPDLSGVYACGVPAMGEASLRDFIAQCTLPQDAFFADAFTTAADLAAR